MAIFQFLQYEHESFWRYFNRLNEYCAQNVDKWEICQVIYEGLNKEYRGHIETMYPGGLWALFFKSPNEIWEFFEYLAQDTWEFENASGTIGHSLPDPYACHVEPYVMDQFVDSFSQPPQDIPHFALVMCAYCQSYDHDINSCPHHDISDSCYAKLKNLIETMDEQNSRFVNEIREIGLVEEPNLNLGYPMLKGCSDDDCESSFPLALDLYDDTHSLDLTLLPSTPKDITNVVMTKPDLLLPLAQSTELEEGGTCEVDACCYDEPCFEEFVNMSPASIEHIAESFDSIPTCSSTPSVHLPNGSSKSNFLEFGHSHVTHSVDLGLTLEHIETERLENHTQDVGWSLGTSMSLDPFIGYDRFCLPFHSPFRAFGPYLGPMNPPRQFNHAFHHMSSPLPSLFSGNVFLVHDWAQEFDKLKRALTCILT